MVQGCRWHQMHHWIGHMVWYLSTWDLVTYPPDMGPGYLPPLVLTLSGGHQNMVDNRAVPTGMLSCLLISSQGWNSSVVLNTRLLRTHFYTFNCYSLLNAYFWVGACSIYPPSPMWLLTKHFLIHKKEFFLFITMTVFSTFQPIKACPYNLFKLDENLC